ncbi:MAG TPA: PhnD/SsuA/transferrin family substrate-binding protein [Actinomycetes bacterium]|nr:PhnD/SsuA/transferrin family substrate-binding protein [Actinomycetes bacterium]
MRGCSWAYNEPASHSGHTVTLYGLVRMGARPGFLGRVVEGGLHQRAIRLVHAGVVDAAAIDSQGSGGGAPRPPGARRPAGRRVLRPVHDSAGGGRQPPPGCVEAEVRELLVSLGDDPSARPMLAQGFIERFAAVDDGAYDDIRAMLATIRAAGWTSLTQTPTAR